MEVYRARDTKLNRDVAIKVLPAAFAHDADRLARFEREAQVLASRNHPNIAAIHGLEESDGVRALVIELTSPWAVIFNHWQVGFRDPPSSARVEPRDFSAHLVVDQDQVRPPTTWRKA